MTFACADRSQYPQAKARGTQTPAVVLRLQTVLSGSGSHRFSNGGSGEHTRTSASMLPQWP